MLVHSLINQWFKDISSFIKTKLFISAYFYYEPQATNVLQTTYKFWIDEQNALKEKIVTLI